MGDKPHSTDWDLVEALATHAQASMFKRACMMLMAWSTTIEEREDTAAMFDHMDTDHDGTIQLREFRAVMEKTPSVKASECDRLFRALDVSSSGTIEYSEFVAA